MSNNTLSVNLQLKILKPPEAVFAAIVDPHQMSGYFISAGSGMLEAGKTVTWSWADVGMGIARCLEQTHGWTHMLCCLKAYLEHHINLRGGGIIEGGA